MSASIREGLSEAEAGFCLAAALHSRPGVLSHVAGESRHMLERPLQRIYELSPEEKAKLVQTWKTRDGYGPLDGRTKIMMLRQRTMPMVRILRPRRPDLQSPQPQPFSCEEWLALQPVELERELRVVGLRAIATVISGESRRSQARFLRHLDPDAQQVVINTIQSETPGHPLIEEAFARLQNRQSAPAIFAMDLGVFVLAAALGQRYQTSIERFRRRLQEPWSNRLLRDYIRIQSSDRADQAWRLRTLLTREASRD